MTSKTRSLFTFITRKAGLSAWRNYATSSSADGLDRSGALAVPTALPLHAGGALRLCRRGGEDCSRGVAAPRQSDLAVSLEACHRSACQVRAADDCPRSAGLRSFLFSHSCVKTRVYYSISLQRLVVLDKRCSCNHLPSKQAVGRRRCCTATRTATPTNIGNRELSAVNNGTRKEARGEHVRTSPGVSRMRYQLHCMIVPSQDISGLGYFISAYLSLYVATM